PSRRSSDLKRFGYDAQYLILGLDMSVAFDFHMLRCKLAQGRLSYRLSRFADRIGAYINDLLCHNSGSPNSPFIAMSAIRRIMFDFDTQPVTSGSAACSSRGTMTGRQST